MPGWSPDGIDPQEVLGGDIKMADVALFIRWGQPVVGREQKAVDVFGESIAYWTQLQQEGVIEGFETYLLDPHGGDLAGFTVLKGEEAKLAEVQEREDFQRSVVRAQLIVENLGIVRAVTGEALKAQMGIFAAQATELT
jgi:hypothetical protein